MTQRTSTYLTNNFLERDPDNWTTDLLDSVPVLDELWTQGSAVHMEDSQAIRFGDDKDASLVHDGTTGLDVSVADDDSGALDVKQGATSYFTVDTTNDKEQMKFAKPVDLQYGRKFTYWELFDDFNYQSSFTEADKPWVLNSGSDAGAADPDVVSEANGVMELTTGTADGTTAKDASQLVSHVPVQATNGNLVFEARLHLDATTNVAVNVGLTDTTSREEPFYRSGAGGTATADDAVCFVYDTDAGTNEWFKMAVDGTTKDANNATLGTAPTGDTDQVLRIEVSSDGATCKFFIDSTLAGTLSGDVGVSPDVNLYPTVVACGDGTAQKTVDVDYVYCGVTR